MHISISMHRSSRFTLTQPLHRMSRCVYGCLCAWCVCVCVCVFASVKGSARACESARQRVCACDSQRASKTQRVWVKVSVCSKYRCVQQSIGVFKLSLDLASSPSLAISSPPHPHPSFPPPSSICALILQGTTYVIFSGKRETQRHKDTTRTMSVMLHLGQGSPHCGVYLHLCSVNILTCIYMHVYVYVYMYSYYINIFCPCACMPS